VTELALQLITTIAAAMVLVLAAAMGITTQRGIRLVIIAIMISLIPEAGRSLSLLRSSETGRRCNEGRRTGTSQSRAGSPKMDR
jgi:hypothetical protein